MPHAQFQQIWPRLADRPCDDMTLAALRHEIDEIDDRLLSLFEKRLALAERVGRAKDAPAGPHVKLRPDREAAVMDRLIARAAPDNRRAVAGLWREIVGWGLARQGSLEVRVWSPIDEGRCHDAARRRFGCAAEIRSAHDAQTVLRWAADGRGVGILSVHSGDPWWIGLRREWSSLTVFEGLGGVAPTALAVGKIDPAALPQGRSVVVQAGGDAGDGAGPRQLSLATHHGWTLALSEARLDVGGYDGCVGAVP